MYICFLAVNKIQFTQSIPIYYLNDLTFNAFSSTLT